MKELLVGIDWSQSHYDVAVLASQGAKLTEFRITNIPVGFAQLAEKLDQFGLPPSACRVGLETAHNILIDFLWSKQYAVYVVPPAIVNSSRDWITKWYRELQRSQVVGSPVSLRPIKMKLFLWLNC